MNILKARSWGSTSSSDAPRLASFRGSLPHPIQSIPGSTTRTPRQLRSKTRFLVLADTTVTPLAHRADVVLSAATFAEKAGTYVNADGRLQYSEAALPPRDGSLADLDILCVLLDRPVGSAVSSDILAELAQAIPAFSAARGGKLPPMGIRLDQQKPPGRAAVDEPSFADVWNLPQGAARWR